MMDTMESAGALHHGPALNDVLWTTVAVVLTGLLVFVTYWLF